MFSPRGSLFTYRRYVMLVQQADTGDASMDTVLQDNGSPTNIIWSIHDSVPSSLGGTLAMHNSAQRGAALINLFNGAEILPPTPPPPSLSPAPPSVPPPSPMPPASPVDAQATSWCEPGNTFCFEWVVAGEDLEITMTGQAAGYLSVGFGELYGKMSPADIIVAWLDANGNVVVSDRKALNAWDVPVINPVQSSRGVRGSYINGEMSITFSRKLSA